MSRLASTLVLTVLVLVAFAARGRCSKIVDVASNQQDFTVIAGNASDGAYTRVGDVDGDGNDDLIVSLRGADGPGNFRQNCGEVHVFFGPLAGGTTIDLATATSDLLIIGGNVDALLKDALVADLDGDTTGDLVLGAPGARGAPGHPTSRVGAVYVFFGGLSASSTPIDLASGAPLVIWGPLPSTTVSAFGSTVAAGDLVGTPATDLVISNHTEQCPSPQGACGAVRILAGPLAPGTPIDMSATAPTTLVYGQTAQSTTQADSFGEGLAVGLLSNDAVADLAITASGADGPADGRVGCGEAFVVFGKLPPGIVNLAVTAPDVRIIGAEGNGPPPATSDLLGWTGALAVGDLTAGSENDLVVGCPLCDGPSRLRVAAGDALVFAGPLSTGTIIDLATTPATLDIFGAVAGDAFGHAIAVGQPVRGGGRELVATAPYAGAAWTPSRSHAGMVNVLASPLPSGPTIDTGLPLDAMTALGGAVDEYAGGSVALGDLNGDGWDDVAWAAVSYDGPGVGRHDCGGVFVAFGVETCGTTNEICGIDEICECPPPNPPHFPACSCATF